MNVVWALLRWLLRREQPVDAQRIHKLEYELGIRDDRPPGGPASLCNAHSALKDVYGH